MAQDYNNTLNLPKTDFPMRGNLPTKEPETLKKWESERLYYKMIEKNHGVVALDVGDILMESHQTTALLRIADRCPDLKVVICHLLAPMREKKNEWKAELQMLKQANVWFDIAAMPKIMAPDVYPYPETVDTLAEARDIIGADRMMWGTDAPFAATQDSYENLTDYLEKSNVFTQKELEDIYYNNAQLVYFD